AGWLTCRISAARPTLFWRATSRKVDRCRNLMRCSIHIPWVMLSAQYIILPNQTIHDRTGQGGRPVQFAEINGVTIHHQVIGAASKPTIVFANSVRTDFRIWRDVVVRLAGEFSVLLYDKRGHGLSETGPTPISIADHAADLAALMDRLGLADAMVCGLSVGGMIAQQLWADRPDLVSSLVLCDTAHRIGTPEFW